MGAALSLAAGVHTMDQPNVLYPSLTEGHFCGECRFARPVRLDADGPASMFCNCIETKTGVGPVAGFVQAKGPACRFYQAVFQT